MSTSRTSLSQQTPTASGAPDPAPSDSAPSSAPVSTPTASARTERLSTVALVIFTSVYAFFFLLHLGHFLVPGDAALSTGLALYIALFTVGCVAFRHPLARAVHQVMAHKRRALLTLIVGGIAILILDLVGTLVSSTLLDLAGLSGVTLQNDSSIGEAMQMFPPIVIVIVLIGRFAPTWVAVVVSSVLFGALHMRSFALSEVLGVIPHAFFGLGCGLLYVKTDRNLLYPASIHCLNNLSAFLPLLLH